MKYKIIKKTDPDGYTTYSAQDENGRHVNDTTSRSVEECEARLLIALNPPEVVKELEID